MFTKIRDLLTPIRQLHEQIRDAVVAETERAALTELSEIAKEEAGDTIYAIDRVSEARLIDFFASEIAPHVPIVLIAEGLDGGEVAGQIVLPEGTDEADAQWRIIVDPIDGTRGLMYQKRPAWILTGVAPNRGPQTNLRDIELAVMTEIPLVKQHLSDVAWAVAREKGGDGAHAERHNRITGEPGGALDRPVARRHHCPRLCHDFALLSPARAKNWPPSMRKSSPARSAPCSRARRTASRISTSAPAGSSTN